MEYEWLEDYVNARAKRKYMCPEGHIHEMTMNNWNKGRRCPSCFDKRRAKFVVSSEKLQVTTPSETFHKPAPATIKSVISSEKSQVTTRTMASYVKELCDKLMAKQWPCDKLTVKEKHKDRGIVVLLLKDKRYTDRTLDIWVYTRLEDMDFDGRFALAVDKGDIELDLLAIEKWLKAHNE